MSNKNVPQIRFKGFDEDWEEKKIEDVYKRSIEKNDLTYREKDIISVANLYYKPEVKVSSKEYLLSYNVFKLGDIAFEGNKSKDFSHGRFVENTIGDGIVSHVFDVYRPIIPYDIQYWKYAINNENVMRSLLIRCTKSATMMSALVASDFLKQKINVPNLSEQSQIGTLFCSLDKQISCSEAKLDKLRTIKKTLLKKMFAASEENIPQIRFKGFDGEWEEKLLGEIGTINSGCDYKHLNRGIIPVYGTGGYMTSVDKALSYTKDAIGIGRKGTIDNPYILKAPFWTVDTLFYVFPKDNINLNFLFNLYCKVDWRSKNEASGVPSLSKGIINNVCIKTASLSEQSRIASLFTSLDKQISLQEQKIEKLKAVKKTLLKKMFV